MWNCANIPVIGNMGGGHFWWGLALLGGLAFLLRKFFRQTRIHGSTADKTDSLEILKLRLAKGEISLEEFNNLKNVL